MKKVLSVAIALCMLFTILAACTPKTLESPQNVKISQSGLISWDAVEHAETYLVWINEKSYVTQTTEFQAEDVSKSFVFKIVAQAKGYKDSSASEEQTFTPQGSIINPPKPEDITVAVKGSSDIRSNSSATYTAQVEGTDDKQVEWSVSVGAEFVESVSEDGTIKAKEVDGDKVIVVRATSKKDPSVYGEKAVTINAQTVLTQQMLDVLNGKKKISFEGYVNVDVYTIGGAGKFVSSNVLTTHTAMDGTNWYAEYETSGVKNSLYFKNHGTLACQIGVDFMNQESFLPMLDSNGNETSWENSGLYNSLHDLKLEDFKFNKDIWRWEYVGGDNGLVDRIILSANPYEFDAEQNDDGKKSFSLIIDGGEVLGIAAKSAPSYTIAAGYRAMQELYVAINYDETVEIPTITKYSHESALYHDELQQAINNMQNLSSYKIDFKLLEASRMGTSGVTEKGYFETVTENDCYIQPYDVKYSNGQESHEIQENKQYGFHKFTADLYNSYAYDAKKGQYVANRAFTGDFANAKPSFKFAAELFRTMEEFEEDGSRRYYVDKIMSQVATTFYNEPGNDAAMYGIFAGEGRISAQKTFTPYITVKDGYITDACFYFDMGQLYGVAEIRYGEFDTAVLPEDSNIAFEARQAPASWSDVKIEVDKDDNLEVEVDGNKQAVALEYMKKYFKDELIADKIPYFGLALQDTYGFGMPSVYTSSHGSRGALAFYFDVPLDMDYTITSSMDTLGKFLVKNGYEKNTYGEYVKDGIYIAPTDSQLDFIIYVWKA